jgi:hypothetical protein
MSSRLIADPSVIGESGVDDDPWRCHTEQPMANGLLPGPLRSLRMAAMRATFGGLPCAIAAIYSVARKRRPFVPFFNPQFIANPEVPACL